MVELNLPDIRSSFINLLYFQVKLENKQTNIEAEYLLWIWLQLKVKYCCIYIIQSSLVVLLLVLFLKS